MIEVATESFQTLIGASLSAFPDEETLEVPVPEGLLPPIHAKMRFVARMATIGQCGTFRSVYITNGKIEIVNIFFFPLATVGFPVYAMEFVQVGPRPVVAVMDLSSVGLPEGAAGFASELLASAHREFPGLTNGDDPPAWYEECRSGADFFIRPSGPAMFAELAACHTYLWTRVVNGLATAQNLRPEEAGAHQEELDAYMDHHRLNSPGLPLLNRTFGTDWTDRFLRQCLFAPDWEFADNNLQFIDSEPTL